ncbi:MAG: hypothetical protein ACHQ50_10805 [Fimbriimonadales bacterium]
MTANGYVRCGGCGGYLPMGAICGYCLQQQQLAAQRMAMPRPQLKPAKPLRTALVLGLCALAVCGVGAAAVYAVRSAGKIAHLSGSSASSIAGLADSGDGAADTLSSKANQQVVSALSSGNTQQALAAMQAAGSGAPPVMQSTTSPQAPALQNSSSTPIPTMEAGNGMPDNVRKWLEHLQKIEQARETLAAAQLQEGVKTLAGLQAGDITHALDDGGDDSQAAEKQKQNERAQHVGGDMGTMRQAWQTLLTAFDSVPAPAECVGIKANYDQVIGQTGTMILQIVGQIKSASSDPQAAIAALTAMQGTSKSKIDVPARAADSGVADVCKRYDTVKWFDITSDVGSGVMSQLGF